MEHRLFGFAFGDRVGRVAFVQEPAGVRRTVTFDAERSHSQEQQRAGWQAIPDNVARHVAASHAAR